MDAKIVIYSRHPQEIRQQKSPAPAFSAAAGRKLKKQDNNLFRTIQTTCGQNAQVLAGKPLLCYRATHHGMTGQTTMHPLPAPLNRHRRRRFTDVVEVGRPTSTMSVWRGYLSPCMNSRKRGLFYTNTNCTNYTNMKPFQGSEIGIDSCSS